MSGMFSSDPTPGEIQFRLGSIPVRIQPWFWLTSFLLAGPWFDQEPRPWPVVTFVAVCFASIVWHELGHAWTMRYFGARYVEIMLTGLGALLRANLDSPIHGNGLLWRWRVRPTNYLFGESFLDSSN